MLRLFCNISLEINQLIELPTNLVQHVMVRRLGPNDAVCLFNGAGGEYVAEIKSVEKRKVIVQVIDFKDISVELPYHITLVQGLPEAGKMDWIIEKAVETGVYCLQPIAAQKSVVKLSTERAEKRLVRWQSITCAASEQCGRNTLMQMKQPCSLEQFLTTEKATTKVMLSPRGKMSLSQWAKSTNACDTAILIGPEGGFTQEEEDYAQAQGVLFLSMGKRILRTETAGIVAVSMLNAFWDID